MLDEFIQAIGDRKKIRLTFYSKEDRSQLVRTCAPMDYGPSRRAKDKSDRYHVWDYDSDMRIHTLSLLPEQVIRIDVLEDKFDPAEFVTWDTSNSPWFIKRDWGQYS
jgi:hypothetical protein